MFVSTALGVILWVHFGNEEHADLSSFSSALHFSFQKNLFRCILFCFHWSWGKQVRELSGVIWPLVLHCPSLENQGQTGVFYFTSEVSAGSAARGGSRGTGDVASMRAGFRMMGKDMGGTPTCSGEAKGWSIRGDWLRGAGDSEELFTVIGTGGVEGGTGDDLSVPVKERVMLMLKHIWQHWLWYTPVSRQFNHTMSTVASVIML